MKKFIKYFLLIIIVLPIIFLSSCDNSKQIKKSYAFEPIDRIDYYEIKVDPREDGTLDMKYKIKWTVLDDDIEGPLSWVKIGIPNCYVNELKALTDNIDEIDYYSDEGSFIRIDFDKNYYEKETVVFEFSFHQERMYHLYEDSVYYHFVPGWFDEIRVGELKVLWNDKNVIESNNNLVQDNYLVWNYGLDFGQSIELKIKYNKNSFVSLSEDLQYSDNYMSKRDIIKTIISVSIFISIIVFIIIMFNKFYDPYMTHRGFIGRRNFIRSHCYYHHHYTSTVDHKGATLVNASSSGSGGGSSCACACACAGGGRAGCSRKDFNHSSIPVEKVIDKIKNSSK